MLMNLQYVSTKSYYFMLISIATYLNNFQQWVISSQIRSMEANIAIRSEQNCVYDTVFDATYWNYYTGTVRDDSYIIFNKHFPYQIF